MTTWKTNKDEQLSTQIQLHQLRRRRHHPYFFVVSSWYLHFSIIHLLDMGIDPCMRDSARTICIDSNKQICPYKYTPDPAKNRTTSDLWKTLKLTDSSSPIQIKEDTFGMCADIQMLVCNDALNICCRKVAPQGGCFAEHVSFNVANITLNLFKSTCPALSFSLWQRVF